MLTKVYHGTTFSLFPYARKPFQSALCNEYKIMTTITFDDSNRLADNPPSSALFNLDAIGDMFRNTLQNHQVNGLFNATKSLADANFPSVSMADIQSEINDIRTQRRSNQQGYYAQSNQPAEQEMCA